MAGRSRRSPTLDDVAAAAGVSRMTASRALNGRPGVSTQLRDQLVRIAAEMGYVLSRPAEKPATARDPVLGLVSVYMHSPFVAEFAVGAMKAARTAGYEMLLYQLVERDEGLRESVTRLLSQVVRGVISVLPHRRDYLDALVAAHVPVISLEMPEPVGCTIVCDNYSGARSAMRHLAELGHRRIAFIMGSPDVLSSKERRRAYEDVMRDRGFPLERALMEQGYSNVPSGFEAARRLLALRNRPTAIFAGNDDMALGALDAARAAGVRVPEELSIVGFDDVPAVARALPPLTTVRQPIEQMGRSAVNTLLAQLAGIEPVSQVITFQTELVVRGSTAPPPRKGRPVRAGRSESKR